MCRVIARRRSLCTTAVFVVLTGWLAGGPTRAAEEPPAINPFGPVKTAREDARPGYLEMSDGRSDIPMFLRRDDAVKCRICLGVIKPGLRILQCTCKKHFHANCAKRVNKCTQCGRSFADVKFTVKKVAKATGNKPSRAKRKGDTGVDNLICDVEFNRLGNETNNELGASLFEEENQPSFLISKTIKKPVRCAICFGEIKPGLKISKCICGNMFHINCANREGECPYCGRPI